MKNRFSPVLRIMAVVAIAVTAACDSATAPGIEPEITNITDSFFYQVRDITNFSGAFEYTWQNGGQLATVSHSTNAGSSGSATVTVLDANGTQVYTSALLTSGEFTTAPSGAAGNWTVRVTFSDYTNSQVNFELSRQ